MKLIYAGSYIRDFGPTMLLINNLTEEQIRELARAFLGIDLNELEPQFSDAKGPQFLMNKTFASFGPSGPGNAHLALYNHDGTYSLRTFTPKGS